MGFAIRILVNSLAILLVANIVPGIEVSNLVAAVGAGLVLGLINAVIRPIMIILTLPITFVTLGLFLVVLNAACLMMTASLVKGFSVENFWVALFGSVLISLVSGLLTIFISDRGPIVVIQKKKNFDQGKVIDHKP